MENQKIKISKKNFDHYQNISDTIVIMKNNIILWEESTESTIHEKNFGIRFKDNINKNIRNKNKLNFKEFIADIKDDEELIEIDYKTYENFIRSSNTFNKVIKLGTINSSDYDPWKWHTYLFTVKQILLD